MKVTVRYIKDGKKVTMDKRYADVLVKARRVEYVNSGFKQQAFEQSIVTKEVTPKEIPNIAEKAKEASITNSWGTSAAKSKAETSAKNEKKENISK